MTNESIMKPIITRRVEKLRKQIANRELDGLLVSAESNVRYLSGFTGDSSVLLITADAAAFLTDFRYVEQAGDECGGYEILMRTGGMSALILKTAKRLGVGTLGVEGGVLTLDSAEQIRSALAGAKIEMTSTAGIVEELRQRKDKDEVAAIEACIDAAEKCVDKIRGYLVPGIRERDIAAEMEYFVRGLGFDGMAFPTIVAFGPRGSLPHAQVTNRRMKPGDMVLIDWGVAGNGYICDLTRVFFHNKIPDRFKRIYRTVLEAQRRAIQKIGPGVKASKVDAAARNTIAKAGFKGRFGHGLGHGIGLQVHEGPVIGAASGVVLKRRMVFTVEPGIYLPGIGGVRIEDDVLVTSRGVKVLSHSPKRLNDMIIGD
jgi:Xaa-Pro aminopeptidase